MEERIGSRFGKVSVAAFHLDRFKIKRQRRRIIRQGREYLEARARHFLDGYTSANDFGRTPLTTPTKLVSGHRFSLARNNLAGLILRLVAEIAGDDIAQSSHG